MHDPEISPKNKKAGTEVFLNHISVPLNAI
jgi:hypothetical protein